MGGGGVVQQPMIFDPEHPTAARILAKTLFRYLRSNGLAEREVIALATELLGLVAEDMRTATD